jgi:hypothetical protein
MRKRKNAGALGALTSLILLVAVMPLNPEPANRALAADNDARQIAPPELPRTLIDTAYPTPTGTVRSVAAGGNVQSAIDAAKPGDVIELAAGATFTGPFTLPVKPGSEYIHIRSSRHGDLPVDGRVGPEHAALMPKIVCPNASQAIVTRPGAHHFWLTGIQFTVAPDAQIVYSVVVLGDPAQASLDAVPHHLVIDRCFMPDTDRTVGRGIELNSAHTAIINSYISGCHGEGFDTQAICGWSGPGPFKIVNNYLAGAGENVMFGGADTLIRDLVPSDIEIRRNHIHKPLEWNFTHPSYAGKHWTVKNLLELKNARRVLIDGNLFENHWGDAQSGHAVLFTVRNQDGKNPWAQVADITATNNILRNAPAGINILDEDYAHPSQRTARIVIRNWLFENIGWEYGNGTNSLFQLLGGDDIVIDRVTCLALKGNLGVVDKVVNRLQFTNNIVPKGAYGLHIDNCGTVEQRLPGRHFDRNVIIGGDASSWAFGGKNAFPADPRAVGFVDLGNRNYRLAPGSIHAGAGADLDAIEAALGGRAGATPTRPRRVQS